MEPVITSPLSSPILLLLYSSTVDPLLLTASNSHPNLIRQVVTFTIETGGHRHPQMPLVPVIWIIWLRRSVSFELSIVNTRITDGLCESLGCMHVNLGARELR